MTSTTPPDIARKVEAYIPRFQLTRLLNQDQAGRRISLLGTIDDQPAVLIAERAAFATDHAHLASFPTSLTKVKNLGANDIYAWFLANSNPNRTPARGSPSKSGEEEEDDENENESDIDVPPDFKINLIYPCTPKHIQKYSAQPLRLVTESPQTYTSYIHPWISLQRSKGTLTWIYNILDGLTEQEDVIYRERGPSGFLLLPDLNWDRKTVGSLHLLGLVERRDVWSVRDLKKGDVSWLKGMREALVRATVGLYGEKGLESDMVKLYAHYQPTYHHFHIHIVHVALEAGNTQATGKALGLENIISQLETMQGGPEAGMHQVDLTYHLGEASELWCKVFKPLKEGKEPVVEEF